MFCFYFAFQVCLVGKSFSFPFFCPFLSLALSSFSSPPSLSPSFSLSFIFFLPSHFPATWSHTTHAASNASTTSATLISGLSFPPPTPPALAEDLFFSFCTSVSPSTSDIPPMPPYRKSSLGPSTSRSPLAAVSSPPLIQASSPYPARASCSAAARDLRPYWHATTILASSGTELRTALMKSGLGFMCTPPSHQPPMPNHDACFIRLGRESNDSGT